MSKTQQLAAGVRNFWDSRLSTRSTRLKIAVLILVSVLLLWLAWQFYSFTALVFSNQNRPFLLRLVLQILEILWFLLLLKTAFSTKSAPSSGAEKILLLTLWLIFGAWFCIQLPMGMAWRDPLLHKAPNLLFFQKQLPFIHSYRSFLTVIWAGLGVCTLLFYQIKKRWADVDQVLLPSMFYMIYLGVFFLARLGPDRMQAGRSALSQSVFLFLAILVSGLLLAPKISSRVLKILDYPYICLLGALILVGGTFFFGTAVSGGRKLWYQLGGLTLQPIEAAKILFVFVLAVFLDKKAVQLKHSDIKGNLVTFGMICALLFGLLVLQKDLGPLLILLLVSLLLFLTVSGRFDIFLGALAATSVGIALSFWTRTPSMVYNRIMDFIDPLHHSGQLTRGLWAQASGGLWGTSPGMSKAYQIPVIESDYIFSLIAAEKGLIGTALYLLIFGLFCFRGFQLSRLIFPASRRDATVILALFYLFLIQGILIMGGNMAFLPLSGLTLPLVSAGGSSLVINFLTLTFVLALVAVRTHRQDNETQSSISTQENQHE